MKKIILYTVLISSLFYSCEESVLDKEPLDTISSSVVWDDPILVESYVADVYQSLPFMHIGNTVTTTEANRYDLPMLETLTDQAGGSRNNRSPAAQKLGNTDETGGLIEMWLYPEIRKMNEFYEYIEGSSMDTEQVDTFIGCIKFVEAFSYFEMAKRYGAVPIIEKAQQITDPQEELYPTRNPEVEVYTYCIEVLDEILDNELLGVTEKSGYPTQGAVLALKSRIALYAASISRFGTVQLDGLLGVPKSDENKFWQIAYDAADEVINGGVYSLYTEYPDDLPKRLYQMSIDKTNSERIFVKHYDGINIGHSYDHLMAPVGFANIATANAAAPYLDFVESFEKIDGSSSTIPREWETMDLLVSIEDLYGGYDPRMEASVLHEGSIYQGTEINFYQGLRLPDGTILDASNTSYLGIPAWGAQREGNETQVLNTGFSVKKYLDENYEDIQSGLSSTDKVIFRLGEIYLNRAEAAFYLNLGDKGLADINTIRERSGMPLRSDITDEDIRYERMAELCFEDGARYWDLIRWRTAVNAITKQFSGIRLIKDFETGNYLVRFETYTALGVPYESRFENRHYYKPITPDRIANNPNLGPENPGY